MASESAELRSAGRHACQCRAGLFVVVVVCVSMSLCIADSAAMLVEGEAEEGQITAWAIQNSSFLPTFNGLSEAASDNADQQLAWSDVFQLLGNPTPDEEPASGAVWSDWSDWGGCQRLLCNRHAVQRRVRHCIRAANASTITATSASSCRGRLYQSRRCQAPPDSARHSAVFGYNSSLPVVLQGRTVVFSCCEVIDGVDAALLHNGKPVDDARPEVSGVYHLRRRQLDVVITDMSVTDTGMYQCKRTPQSTALRVVDLDDVIADAARDGYTYIPQPHHDQGIAESVNSSASSIGCSSTVIVMLLMAVLLTSPL
ncbi:uncharacterized protein LOC135830114 [Sycon ciliatum]|uniref:uncharacterized protein LOC135830114 n=1 Tax=Sycon ciliatum TaxID=27933 RepID=UPI0020AD5928